MFLIDEDLPRTLASELTSAGFPATDVRDVNLSGTPDPIIHRYAQQHGLVLVSADVEFGNVILYPPGTHAGIILLRIPNELAAPKLRARVVAFVRTIPPDRWRGRLFVVEPDRVRIRDR